MCIKTDLAELYAVRDVRRLWRAQQRELETGRLERLHADTQRRIAENAVIQRAESLCCPIAVVWSGRDCDGVAFSGRVSLIDLNPESPWGTDKNGEPFKSLRAAVTRHINKTYDYADGPMSYVIMSKADAEYVEYASRDLGMEAFENGHSHVLYA